MTKRRGVAVAPNRDVYVAAMVGILIGAAVAFVATLIGTPVLIRWLKAAGIGQLIHASVTKHSAKAGTPTMGGLIIPVGLVIGCPLGCALSGTPLSKKAWTVIATVVGGCIVGVVDDWLKVRRGREHVGDDQVTVCWVADGRGFAQATETITAD
jgi:UDP-N-acetylmuramyl pentapeptide phosphotransferase/UDP-N-acetylglucosamine-1-phosphate transferase